MAISFVVAVVLVATCLVAAVPVSVDVATSVTTTETPTATTTATTTPAPTPVVCSTHGEKDVDGVCQCETGFAGVDCELVIVSGQMLYEHKHPVGECNINVYATDDINANENLVGHGKCNSDGEYSITVPYRHRYVVSGKNQHGSEARQFFFVPHTKEHRDDRNSDTRHRRSHTSNWKNPVLALPGWMYGEMWYAHIFWGWDHTVATCNLNINVHTPYPLTQYGYINGCTTDTWYNTGMCQTQIDPAEHNALPYTSDVSCNSNQYGYGYENMYIMEANASVPFEIFTYNPSLTGANYDSFRHPNSQLSNGGQGVFALAALYNADPNGWAQLLSTVDLTKASQSSLASGLYWHIWSLVIDTIPDNVEQFAAGNGVWTVRNTVSCSPINMVYTNARQPWEPANNPYFRGNSCGKQF